MGNFCDYRYLFIGNGGSRRIFMKKNNSAGDYYLGGRKLGPVVTAMSAEASDMSSWLLMGLPGVAYLDWCGRCSMDSHRSGNWNVLKLVDCGEEITSLYCRSK